MILYGIKTCDTCRKALKSLTQEGHSVTFRDIRTDPLSPQDWTRFLTHFGPDLINTRSTTWRGLSEAERAGTPASLLTAHPTLMKRPVIADGEQLTLGWTPAIAAQLTAH